jgi:hypothetical protein
VHDDDSSFNSLCNCFSYKWSNRKS